MPAWLGGVAAEAHNCQRLGSTCDPDCWSVAPHGRVLKLRAPRALLASCSADSSVIGHSNPSSVTRHLVRNSSMRLLVGQPSWVTPDCRPTRTALEHLDTTGPADTRTLKRNDRERRGKGGGRKGWSRHQRLVFSGIVARLARSHVYFYVFVVLGCIWNKTRWPAMVFLTGRRKMCEMYRLHARGKEGVSKTARPAQTRLMSGTAGAQPTRSRIEEGQTRTQHGRWGSVAAQRPRDSF